jgi:hypothetical protein
MPAKKIEPKVDMTWLSDWITLCRKGPTKVNRAEFDNDMRLTHRGKNRDRFERLVADSSILHDVTKTYQAMVADSNGTATAASARAAIKRYLSAACWTPNIEELVRSTKDLSLSPNRSDTARDLQRLGVAAKKLAGQIRSLRQPLGAATSLVCLQERLARGNPDGYANERREFATYRADVSKKPRESRLQQLLDCFAKDATEAAQRLKDQIKKNREIGGRRAHLNSFIDAMLSSSAQLATSQRPLPNFAMISNIGAHIFEEPLDISTIRKRYRATRHH